MTFLLEHQILASCAAVGVVALLFVLTVYFAHHLDNWVLWYLFFLPIAPQVAIGKIPFSFIDILFGTGLVGFLINILLNKKNIIPLNRVNYMTLLFLGYLFISCLFSSSLWGWKIGLLVTVKFIRQIGMYLPFFILSSLVNILDTQFVKKMVCISIIGGTISAGLSLITFYTPLSFYRLYAGRYEMFYIDFAGKIVERAVGVFLEPNHLATFLSFVILMIVVIVLNHVSFINKKLLFVSLIFLISSMLLTFSRGGWINLSLGVLIYFLFDPSKIKAVASKMLFIFFTAIIMIYCFYPKLGISLFNRVNKTFQAENLNNAFSGRTKNWKYLLKEVFPTSPIMGIGYKVNSILPNRKPPDNVPIMLLVEGGIIGGVIFFVWYLLISIHLMSLPKSSWMVLFLISSWLGISFQMLTVDILTYWRALPYFFSFLALTFNQNLIKELKLYNLNS